MVLLHFHDRLVRYTLLASLITIVPYSSLQLHFVTNVVSADHSPGPFREQGQLGLKAALTMS